MTISISIRPEQPRDIAAIDAVHRAAFPTDAEARLVARLRLNSHACVSLVADASGRIVGHAVFSPIKIVGNETGAIGLGLAPVAVLPEHQRQGIGSSLIKGGLELCRQSGCPFVVVLGHPAYYPRFGFQTASTKYLANEYDADDAFMVLELVSGSLPPGGGLVQYGSEFAEFR